MNHTFLSWPGFTSTVCVDIWSTPSFSKAALPCEGNDIIHKDRVAKAMTNRLASAQADLHRSIISPSTALTSATIPTDPRLNPDSIRVTTTLLQTLTPLPQTFTALPCCNPAPTHGVPGTKPKRKLSITSRFLTSPHQPLSLPKPQSLQRSMILNLSDPNPKTTSTHKPKENILRPILFPVLPTKSPRVHLSEPPTSPSRIAPTPPTLFPHLQHHRAVPKQPISSTAPHTSTLPMSTQTFNSYLPCPPRPPPLPPFHPSTQTST